MRGGSYKDRKKGNVEATRQSDGTPGLQVCNDASPMSARSLLTKPRREADPTGLAFVLSVLSFNLLLFIHERVSSIQV